MRDGVFQSLAFQKLHGNESLSVLFANVVNSADVRMIECRRRLRLPLKSRQCLRVFGHVGALMNLIVITVSGYARLR